jgi:hypothetical protein
VNVFKSLLKFFKKAVKNEAKRELEEKKVEVLKDVIEEVNEVSSDVSEGIENVSQDILEVANEATLKLDQFNNIVIEATKVLNDIDEEGRIAVIKDTMQKAFEAKYDTLKDNSAKSRLRVVYGEVLYMITYLDSYKNGTFEESKAYYLFRTRNMDLTIKERAEQLSVLHSESVAVLRKKIPMYIYFFEYLDAIGFDK